VKVAGRVKAGRGGGRGRWREVGAVMARCRQGCKAWSGRGSGRGQGREVGAVQVGEMER